MNEKQILKEQIERMKKIEKSLEDRRRQLESLRKGEGEPGEIGESSATDAGEAKGVGSIP